jgi:orotate phosphoribosyltransferase
LNVLEELKARGLVATDGHFVYKSGKHGTDSVDKDALYRDIGFLSDLAYELAVKFEHCEIDVVTGPDGSNLAMLVGLHLCEKKNRLIHFVNIRKSTGKSYTLSNADRLLVRDKRVLVVDDIIDTGATAKGVVNIIRDFNGKIVGVGAICNRGSSSPEEVGQVPRYIALAQLGFETWPAELCRAKGPCRRGIPFTQIVGTGKSSFPLGK